MNNSEISPLISFQNVTKKFGSFTALDDVSFDVRAGESVALWGSNGAGKTTVIRCVLGLLRYRGTISIGGCDIAKAGKAVRSQVGYVPQELAFHDDLGLLETLHFFAKLRRVDGLGSIDEVEARIVGALS